MGFSGLQDRLPSTWKKITIVFAMIMTLVLLGLLAYYGFFMCKNQFDRKIVTAALRIPEYVAGASIPIGALLTAVRTVQFFSRQYKNVQ